MRAREHALRPARPPRRSNSERFRERAESECGPRSLARHPRPRKQVTGGGGAGRCRKVVGKSAAEIKSQIFLRGAYGEDFCGRF